MANVYDLEYRAVDDDAWYGVCVGLDAVSEKLTVKCSVTPEVQETVLSAADFETETQVEELVCRFRPLSQQLQDHDCKKVSVGTTVCASDESGENELKFYDALVEAVDHKPHSFAGGEEQCGCTFVILWKHGRSRHTLTALKIASMCYLVPATQIDPRIHAFANMAKNKMQDREASLRLNSPTCQNEVRSSKKGDLELDVGPERIICHRWTRAGDLEILFKWRNLGGL